MTTIESMASFDNDSWYNNVIGCDSQIRKGSRNTLIGRNSSIVGNDNFVVGNGNNVEGNNCFIMASNQSIKGDNIVIIDFTVRPQHLVALSMMNMGYTIDTFKQILIHMANYQPVSFQAGVPARKLLADQDLKLDDTKMIHTNSYNILMGSGNENSVGNDNFVLGTHVKVNGNNNFVIGHGPLEVNGDHNFVLFVQIPQTINGSDHIIVPLYKGVAVDLAFTAQMNRFIITTAIDSLEVEAILKQMAQLRSHNIM